MLSNTPFAEGVSEGQDSLNPWDSNETVEQGTHTYPPRPVQKEKRNLYFPNLLNFPLAKGYKEKLDTINPPINTSKDSDNETSSEQPKIEITKGSLMLS